MGILSAGILTVLFLSSCTQRTLPKSYGIYIQDGNRLVKLDAPSSEPRDFSPSVSFIIFDRRLSSGFANPREIARILVRRYVRLSIERIHEQTGGPVSDYVITPADRFTAFGEPLRCEVMPIKGEAEMIELKPATPLQNGLYYFEVAQQRIPFSVGAGAMPESQTPGAVDQYYDTVSERAGFSWDAWLTMANRGSSGENFRGNNFVNNASYRDTAELETLILSWREEFERLLPAQRFIEAAKRIRWLGERGQAQGLKEQLLKALLETAHAAEKRQDWQIAAALANRALGVFASNTDALSIRDKATSQLKLWNQQQLEQRENWEKEIRTPGKVLFSANYVSHRESPVMHLEEKSRVTLREHYLINDREIPIVGGIEHDEIWIDDLGDCESEEENEKFDYLGNRGRTYYKLTIQRAHSEPLYLEFSAKVPRDQLVSRIKEATARYNKDFDPGQQAPVGHMARMVEGDALVYLFDLDNDYWSLPVQLPDQFVQCQWQAENHVNFKIKTPDGKEHEGFAGNSDRVQLRSGDQVRFARYWANENVKLKVTITLP